MSMKRLREAAGKIVRSAVRDFAANVRPPANLIPVADHLIPVADHGRRAGEC